MQIFIYALALVYAYISSFDTTVSLRGIGTVIPLGFFILIGIINAILLVRYFVKFNEKNKIDKTLIALVIVVVLLAFLLQPLFAWAFDLSDIRMK